MSHHENFAQLLEESFPEENMNRGALIKATVVEVGSDFVTVSGGLKSDAYIPVAEFRNEKPEVGDEIDVVVDNFENGFGETRLSREKAIRAAAWRRLEALHKENELVMGQITERVKGGFTVDLGDINAFLPGSLVDLKPVRDTSYLEGKDLEYKIIKMDKKRNNIVVSRRAVLEAEESGERMARIEELQEGQEIVGVVKNITDYGAFVDLGGVDGLLHITDMAWKRVKHPSEMMQVGDELRVKILRFDREKNRVSLGLKQLGEDPWINIERRYPVDSRLYGKVTNITEYGCFVELEEGVEGLVHMSEMDWTNKNAHPNRIVKLGDEVEVMVLEISEERRRISLGIKQCKENPWDVYAEAHEVGEKISAHVRSITDFGLFIGLDGEIDGLVHLSDLSWSLPGEEAVKAYQKGQEVEAVILAMDPERERISLGVKQLEQDPVGNFMAALTENQKIMVTVASVEKELAHFDLAEDVKGVLRSSDYLEPVDDLTDHIKVGEELEVRPFTVDRKTHEVVLSMRPPRTKGDKAASSVQAGTSTDSAASTTLGDLLKEQMQGDADKG